MATSTRKGYRKCKGKCGRNRALRFYTGTRGRICQTCRRNAGRDYSRGARLMETYEITLEEYDALLAAQGGVCAICRNPRTYNLDVDHDHDEEKALLAAGYPLAQARRYSIRGLCCKRCNRRLLPSGLNEPEVFMRAAEYVRRPWLAQGLLNPPDDGQ